MKNNFPLNCLKRSKIDDWARRSISQLACSLQTLILKAFRRLNVKLFISLALPFSFILQSLSLPLHGEQAQMKNFLEIIASAEASSWGETVRSLGACFEGCENEKSIAEKLNNFSGALSKEKDLEWTTLYQRALRNHDTLSKEKANPFPLYYKNYQPPLFLIPDIRLTLDIQKEKVRVITDLTVKRNSSSQQLVLDGVGHTIYSVSLNGKTLPRSHFRATPHELILLQAPKEEQFSLSIESEIHPYNNLSLEGLYASGPYLTTQCESEGARKIFYTLDRPDVLTRFTTTLIADPKQYPQRLSNGHLISETILPNGKTQITWEDPIPKPSYLFASVLGDFGKVEDTFVTRSNRKVKLEVFVEKGSEERALFSLQALKWAMKFDEDHFDREYDLNHLKMVGINDFNAGAMENKGLMIFNNLALLVDEKSGTDAAFRQVACTVAHEYFHNWSGNRVTIRNWFELALKEAFTDFRAMLFGEWLFGSAFIRPKSVTALRDGQFPEEHSDQGHPLIVDSYIDPHSIYDATTYVKGREVFRSLQNYLDMMTPDGFRKAQNLYFERYDGQAVTFKELLTAANEILINETGKDLSLFEAWFYRQGTPKIQGKLLKSSSKNEQVLEFTQTNPHPKTGKEQAPLPIPLYYELLKEDGSCAIPKTALIFSEAKHSIKIPSNEKLIPAIFHDYTAPVILEPGNSPSDLAILLEHANDPFIRWEAGQNYAGAIFLELYKQAKSNQALGNVDHWLAPYRSALKNRDLSLLTKAQLLQIPSIRSLSQHSGSFDFPLIEKIRTFLIRQIGSFCKKEIQSLLSDYPEPSQFKPTSEQMQIRELRNSCWHILASSFPDQISRVETVFHEAKNFDTYAAAFRILSNLNLSKQNKAIEAFYERWKEDKTVFNYWLQSQSQSSCCTIYDLQRLMTTEGYDPQNPNHIRSVIRSFLANLPAYHDAKGDGYRFIVDQIIHTAKFNAQLAHNHLAVPAFIDYEYLPDHQKTLMTKEMKRLLKSIDLPQTRDLIEKKLKHSFK